MSPAHSLSLPCILESHHSILSTSHPLLSSSINNYTECLLLRFAPLLQASAALSSPSRIIITASVAGLGVGSLGENATFGYSASKAAAIHLARNLAVELGPRHILVNSVAPGFFPSKMASGLMELNGGEEKMAKENPDGRLGTPEDIAGVVVFLASRAAGHVNGACITIDGGSLWGKSRL